MLDNNAAEQYSIFEGVVVWDYVQDQSQLDNPVCQNNISTNSF